MCIKNVYRCVYKYVHTFLMHTYDIHLYIFKYAKKTYSSRITTNWITPAKFGVFDSIAGQGRGF